MDTECLMNLMRNALASARYSAERNGDLSEYMRGYFYGVSVAYSIVCGTREAFELADAIKGDLGKLPDKKDAA